MINKLGTGAFARYLIAGVLIVVITGASSANQKNQKKNKEQASPAADASGSVLTSPISTQIDQAIGEMLGAFQLGDIETILFDENYNLLVVDRANSRIQLFNITVY